MTKAGERTLCRETTAQHKETGVTVEVTNAGIPTEQYQPKHSEQMTRTLLLLSEKLGVSVMKNECFFEFAVVEIN